MFGTTSPDNTSSLVSIVTHVPQWKEKGRIEQGLFSSKDEIEQIITDDFLGQMAREAKNEREKIEANIKKKDEENKRLFLKNKWHNIISFLAKNYKGIDIESETLHPEVSAEVKRCMLIPSEFLRTKLVTECKQCSTELWKTQEHYKVLRHPQDSNLDFDGHFPEDHIKLCSFTERSKEEKEEYQKNKVRYSYIGILPKTSLVDCLVDL